MPEYRTDNGKFAATPLFDRFWKKVVKTNGCWIWDGKKQEDGYGRLRVGKIEIPAHHVSYFLKYGEWLPHGYEPDHTCKNPSCIRWGFGHIELVTREEHVKRTSLTHRNRVKTHCVRGHSRWAFRPDNRRYCMDCNNMRSKGLV